MGCGSSTAGETRNHDNRPAPKEEDEIDNRPKKDDFVNEALQAHNELRSKHGAPALRVAEDLNEYAQNWAENIAKRDTMEHSKCVMKSGERIGENIFMCWSSDPSAGVKSRSAVQSWYDEIKDYNFNNATFAMNTGHFTQVVWKGSEEMGIGKAQSKEGSWYVVANYRPPGNMMGDFEKNVLPKM